MEVRNSSNPLRPKEMQELLLFSLKQGTTLSNYNGSVLRLYQADGWAPNTTCTLGDLTSRELDVPGYAGTTLTMTDAVDLNSTDKCLLGSGSFYSTGGSPPTYKTLASGYFISGNDLVVQVESFAVPVDLGAADSALQLTVQVPAGSKPVSTA